MSSKEKFQMTPEEVNEIKSALQKEEFRKLLVEYAKEISDPVNRQRYEEEITQMERERGQDVKFLHPKPGFVVKAKDVNTGKKLFLNLCQNELVGMATAVPSASAGKGCQKWSIPYSLTPPKEDIDSEKRRCMVYDVIFNPSTFEKGEKDPKFRQLLIDTALGGLQRQWDININKKALRFPKMAYKGVVRPTVVRRPRPGGPPPEAAKSPLPFPYPEPIPGEGREEEGGEGEEGPAKEGEREEKTKERKEKKEETRPDNEPKYTVVHRGEVELTDFTNSRVSNAVKPPKELVVKVDLTGVRTVADVELEVFERRLELHSQNPVYKLELDLHYSVNCDRASAKFEKTTQALTVILPVLPSTLPSNDLSPPVGPPQEGAGLQEDKGVCSSPEESRKDVSAPPPKQGTNEDSPTIPVDSTHPSSVAHGERPLLPATVRRCPPYRYRHDDKQVVFVLDVSGVNPGTVVTHFDDNWAHITFSTASESCSFFVKFESSCRCVPSECSVDVAPDNVLAVLRKVEGSGAEWSSFTVGPTAGDTSKKLFYTPHNVQGSIQELRDPWLRSAECEEGGKDVSCKFEEGALWVEVTRTDSQEVEENGCGGDGSDSGELCGDGSDSDRPTSAHETQTEVESQPAGANSLPANDTSLSDSNSTDVTMSPPGDSLSPHVNDKMSSGDNNRETHGSNDNVTPTGADIVNHTEQNDKVDQTKRKDAPSLPLNMFPLPVGNKFVFDLD